MAKARLAKHPKAAPREIPAEEESQEEPEQAFQLEPANDNKPSKAEMVRAALADGMEKPQDGVDWIKAKYGIDLPKPMWSSYVAGEKRRQSGEPSIRGRPRANSSSVQQFATIPQDFGADVKAVKELMERAGGADELTALVDSVGRMAEKYGTSGLKDLIAAFG